jgi:ribosomal protein S27AE
MFDFLSDFSISAHICNQRRKAACLALGALALCFAGHVHAQATTQVHDTSPLHPPAGAKVAIVEFEDQECPDCGAANPVLKAAAAKYNIPWVRHDFPLKFHNWSHQAAVYARWFDTKSKKMGDDYRDFIFANQPSIETLAQLTQITGKFAAEHGQALPFAVDPQADHLGSDGGRQGAAVYRGYGPQQTLPNYRCGNCGYEVAAQLSSRRLRALQALLASAFLLSDQLRILLR